LSQAILKKKGHSVQFCNLAYYLAGLLKQRNCGTASFIEKGNLANALIGLAKSFNLPVAEGRYIPQWREIG
jgi:hypothetical protein